MNATTPPRAGVGRFNLERRTGAVVSPADPGIGRWIGNNGHLKTNQDDHIHKLDLSLKL